MGTGRVLVGVEFQVILSSKHKSKMTDPRLVIMAATSGPPMLSSRGSAWEVIHIINRSGSPLISQGFIHTN